MLCGERSIVHDVRLSRSNRRSPKIRRGPKRSEKSKSCDSDSLETRHEKKQKRNFPMERLAILITILIAVSFPYRRTMTYIRVHVYMLSYT